MIICTELRGLEMELADDPLFFYLALPFGWNGSPGISPLVGDFVREVVAGYRSNTPRWESELAFSVGIFADGLMIIEPEIGRRPAMVVASTEWVVQQALGWDSVRKTKKK